MQFWFFVLHNNTFSAFCVKTHQLREQVIEFSDSFFPRTREGAKEEAYHHRALTLAIQQNLRGHEACNPLVMTCNARFWLHPAIPHST